VGEHEVAPEAAVGLLPQRFDLLDGVVDGADTPMPLSMTKSMRSLVVLPWTPSCGAAAVCWR
jgi:hypothetical protein